MDSQQFKICWQLFAHILTLLINIYAICYTNIDRSLLIFCMIFTIIYITSQLIHLLKLN